MLKCLKGAQNKYWCRFAFANWILEVIFQKCDEEGIKIPSCLTDDLLIYNRWKWRWWTEVQTHAYK